MPPAQADVLAQQVADLQDEAYAREQLHAERVAALQAAVERLSSEDAGAAEARAELERQVSRWLCPHVSSTGSMILGNFAGSLSWAIRISGGDTVVVLRVHMSFVMDALGRQALCLHARCARVEVFFRASLIVTSF